MAKLYLNNLHGSGAGKTGVRNAASTATITVAIEDDFSLIHVTNVTDAGVTTHYEAPLSAAGAAPAIGAGVEIGAGALIFTGAAANAAAAYAEVLTTGAIGSLYLSTAGSVYVQVANAGAASDWGTVTTT
jgi:alpha-D-ribose 1-methylphosphonate 5-triphosphate diphosphatase PhnM